VERGNPQIKRTFDRYCLFAWKPPDRPGFQSPGRPDYQVTRIASRWGYTCGEFIWVEAKDGHDNFALSQISDEQRTWMTYGPRALGNEHARDERYVFMCWLWLWFGDRVGGKENPRAVFLVPWCKWLDIESTLNHAGLSGLSYITPHKLEHRGKHSAVDLLKEFQLEWAGDNSWSIPETNPIMNFIKGDTH
jgi:hypothetical protein